MISSSTPRPPIRENHNFDPETGEFIHPGPLLHGMFEINGIRFPIDPLEISISEENTNFKFETLRTRESSKVRSGHSRINISVSTIFTGVSVGLGDHLHDTRSLLSINETLMPILYSLKKMPLCFIDNELLRHTLPIVSHRKTVTVGDEKVNIVTGEVIGAFLKSVNIGTVPGMPHALTAQFEFIWYNHRPFTPRLKFRKSWYGDKEAELSQLYWPGGKKEKTHVERHKFLQSYGHPSIAYNAAAFWSQTEDIQEAVPLREFLWPYIFPTTNPSINSVRELKDLESLPPFIMGSFDRRVSFTFPVMKAPPKNILEELLKITGADQAVRLTAKRNAAHTKADRKVGPLTQKDVQEWARELHVQEDVLVAAIMIQSEAERRVPAERDAVIHSLFNRVLSEGQGAWKVAVGSGRVTGPQGGVVHYSTDKIPNGNLLARDIDWVRKVLKDRAATGNTRQNITLFIHPDSQVPKAYQARVAAKTLKIKDIPLEDRIIAAEETAAIWAGSGAVYVLFDDIPVRGVYTLSQVRVSRLTSRKVKAHAAALLEDQDDNSSTKIEEVTTMDPQDAPEILAQEYGLEGLQGATLNNAVRKKVEDDPKLSDKTKEIYRGIIDLADKGWTLLRNEITGKVVMLNSLTLEAESDSQGVIPLGVNMGFGNNLAILPLEGHRFPTVQYIGGQQTVATLSLRCEGDAGRRFIAEFKSLLNSAEEAAIYFREFSSKRGIDISNSFLNSINITNVMVESLSTDTISGNPEGLMLNLTLIDSTMNPAKNTLLLGKNETDLESITNRGIKLLIQKGWLHFEISEFEDHLEGGQEIQDVDASGDGAGYAAQYQSLSGGYTTRVIISPVVSEQAPESLVTMLQRIADLFGRKRIASNWIMNRRTLRTAEEYIKISEKKVPADFRSSLFQEAFWVYLFGSEKTVGVLEKRHATSIAIGNLIRKMIILGSEDVSGNFKDKDLLALKKDIVEDFTFDPRQEAYPDLMLPPNPITGLVADTTPDFFLVNESDIKLANSNLLKVLHGSDTANLSKEIGLSKAFDAIDDTAQNIRYLYGVDPPVAGGILPAHLGRDSLYSHENDNKFKTYALGSSVTRGVPDLVGALITFPEPGKLGTNIGARFEGSGYKRDDSLMSTYQNSPSKPDPESKPVNLNRIVHTFQEGEYKRIFEEFTTNYTSEHYAVRRSFPTFKVYFIDEQGERARNEDDEAVSNFVTAFALDDFYGVNSVKEISIVKNKEMAADTCLIQILDLDGVLYNRNYLPPGSEFGLRDTKSKARRNPFLNTIIKEGMKLIVKMGFSNDPANLETIFCGQIASFEGSTIIEIIAQSYGSELVSHTFGSDPSENADNWNSETGELLHDLLDREEVRHFGRWQLRDIDLTGALFGHEKLRPDGHVEKVWTWKPSVVDDNLFIPDVADYSTIWARAWGDLEYVYFDTTIWDVFKEMELRHPGYIAYPVPYGDGIDGRMTIFFGQPDMEYLYRPSSSPGERIAEETGNNAFAVRDAIIKLGGGSSGTRKVGKRGPGSLRAKRLTKEEEYLKGLEVLASAEEKGSMDLIQGVVREADGDVEGVTLAAPSARKQLKILQELANTTQGGVRKIPVDKFWKATQFSQAFRLKPFRNYELVTSLHDIIDNSIRCDHRDTYNSVELVYTQPGLLPGNYIDLVNFSHGRGTGEITVNADDNIKEHHLRREIESKPNCTTDDLSRRYASQLLANSLKRTYKGELIMIGKPKLKPYDILWVYDNYSDMAGPIEIEEVVHTFSNQTGFITEVVPNMIVAVKDGVTTTQVDAVGAFFTETLKEFTNGAILGLSLVSIGTLGGVLAHSGTTAVHIGGGLTVGASFATTVLPTVASTIVVAAVPDKEDDPPLSAAAGFLSGVTLGALAATFPLPVSVAGVIAGKLLYKFVKYNMTREPIIITPLIKQGKPFVTGLEGMESDGLVVHIEHQWKYFIDGFKEAGVVIEQGYANWISR